MTLLGAAIAGAVDSGAVLALARRRRVVVSAVFIRAGPDLATA